MTAAFDNPPSDLLKRTFPGAAAKPRLEVTTATMTVAMRLSLNGFDWTTRTGRRNPGPEPVGIGKDAHHNSPRFISDCLDLRMRHDVFQGRVLYGINRVQPLRNGLGAVP